MSAAEHQLSRLKDPTSRNNAIVRLSIISSWQASGPEEILAAAGLIPALIEIFVETPLTDWHIKCLLDIFKDLASCDKTRSALTKDHRMISGLMFYSRNEDEYLAKPALEVLEGLSCLPREREILSGEDVFSLYSMIIKTCNKGLLAPLVGLITNLLYHKEIQKTMYRNESDSNINGLIAE